MLLEFSLAALHDSVDCLISILDKALLHRPISQVLLSFQLNTNQARNAWVHLYLFGISKFVWIFLECSLSFAHVQVASEKMTNEKCFD